MICPTTHTPTIQKYTEHRIRNVKCEFNIILRLSEFLPIRDLHHHINKMCYEHKYASSCIIIFIHSFIFFCCHFNAFSSPHSTHTHTREYGDFIFFISSMISPILFCRYIQYTDFFSKRNSHIRIFFPYIIHILYTIYMYRSNQTRQNAH